MTREIKGLESDRRVFLQTLAGFLLGSHLVGGRSIALAQGAETIPISTLTTSQRLLLDGVIYKDTVAYIAFADVIRQNIRGSEGAKRFDEELARVEDRIKGSTSEERVQYIERGLSEAIRDRILVDLQLNRAQTPDAVSLRRLLSNTVPTIGVTSRLIQGDTAGSAPSVNLPRVTEILRSVENMRLVPWVPTEKTKFTRDSLALLVSDGGFAALLAQSMEALAKADDRAARDIQAALLDTIRGMKLLADGIGAFRVERISGGLGPNSPNYRALASDLANGLVALGKAAGLDQRAVQKLGRTINLAGAVLSGAAAGASLGPYGAVVGGVVGLLGGLFGGSGSSDDAMAVALSQLDAKISRLHQEMQVGFAQIGQHLLQLSQQMQAGFDSLSTQMQSLRTEILENFENLLTVIRQSQETALREKIDGLLNATHEHEIQFRQYRIANVTIPIGFAGSVRTATRELLDTIRTEDVGFCGSAFVGQLRFEGYLDDFSTRLAKRPMLARMPLSNNFSGLPPTELFDPGELKPPFTHPPRVAIDVEVERLTKRLRHNRYGIEDERPPNGAGIIRGIQAHCYEALRGIKGSPEGNFSAQRPEREALLPEANAACPPPVAPEDLWGLLSTVQQSSAQLSNANTAADLLSTCLPYLRSRIAAHYLLVGQNSLPALLFVRRQVAKTLVNDIAVVFCNPFMAAVDVFRRVVATKLSERVPHHRNHSSIRIARFEDARRQLAQYQRSSMPLAGASSIKFGTHDQEVDRVRREIEKLFLGQRVDPKVTDAAGPSYLLGASNFSAENFATRLPGVTRSVEGGGAAALTNRLKRIRSGSFVLGLVERCVQIRLECLRVGAANVSVPRIQTWSEGLQEYGMIASYALAPRPPEPSGVDPEFGAARAILESVLGNRQGPSVVGNPEIPVGLPAEGRPYPATVGSLWGWGAEHCRPDTPTSDDLMAALLRPECAFAGENGAIMAAVEVFSELQMNLQLLTSSPDVLSILRRHVPNFRQELRKQLERPT